MRTPHVPLLDVAAQRGLVGGPFGSSLGQKDYAPSGVPVIRGTNLGFGRALGGEYVCVSEDKVRNDLARNTAEPGDLVFTQRGTLGQVALVPDTDFAQYVVSQSQMRLRVNPLVASAEYLYYACSSSQFLKQIDDNAISTGVPHINLGILSRLSVPLPNLPTQQAIAEVLGALDDKIAANTKLAQTSAVLAQALFAGSMRAAAHEVALYEVTELLSRGVAPKYSHSEDTVVVLNQKCIRDQRVNLDPARRTLISKVRGDKMLRMDDVLVNSTGQGTLGRVARWTNSGSVTVDSHITIVRFDQAKVDPVCAGMALLASQKTIEEMGEGSTGQTELSRTELGKLRIRLPESSRQAELGHRIKSMSEMESARLSENQTLAATRDTLLPLFMSGKLRVKDAEKVLENAGV